MRVESQDEPLFGKIGVTKMHFSMCNPPFYSSQEEISKLREQKKTRPSSRLTYTNNESVFPGGEVAFISRIITESSRLGEQIIWYTSLVGVKSHIEILCQQLVGVNAAQIKVMSSHVGETKRWILAWSFVRKSLKRDREELELILPGRIAKDPLTWLDGQLQTLAIQKDQDNVYQVNRNTWSRKYRRMASRGEEDTSEANFAFTIDLIGRVIKFSVVNKIEGKWDDFVSLVNHLRDQLNKVD